MPKGTSVMAAAMSMGTKIPRLCATDSVEAFGSCRLCLVEIEGRRGTPASCTTPADEGMVVHTQNERLAKLRKGVMELYISDHPLNCLTCSANGDCELQDQAGAVGLRNVRYGYGGDNHLNDAPTDNSNPYFSFEKSKCIVCSRCVRACEEVQGTFALTIEGRGFGSAVSASGTDFFNSECVSCGACVQACPTATLNEKSVIEMGKAEHSALTTCAYCGVGCTFKAEMQGEKVVRMVPAKAGKANDGHSCVKGRFAYGYATHKDRITKPMIRKQITDPWREVSWEEAIDYAASEFSASRRNTARIRSAASPPRAAPTRRPSRPEAGARGLRQQQRRHLRPRLPFADRLWPEDDARHIGRHAGLQVRRGMRRHPRHRRQPDGWASGVRLAHEEAAARRRQADRRRPAQDRPRQVSAHPGRLSPAAEARHQRGLHQRDEPRHRHRGADRRGFRQGTLRRPTISNPGRASSPRTGTRPRRRRTSSASRPRICAAAARLYASKGKNAGDLLRPRGHRAQPGLDDGDGHGQHRHGHRQHRQGRRRREPAARPEQRPGLVRHGLVPARVPGLPPRLGRRDARDLREPVGRQARPRPGPAHHQHAGRGRRGLVQGHVHPGRGHRAVRPRHAPCDRPA